MKTIRLASLLAVGATAVASFAILTHAQSVNPTEDIAGPATVAGQSSINPGATGLERANSPFYDDRSESIGMRQERADVALGNLGPLDVNLFSVAISSSVARMLSVDATVAKIQSAAIDNRLWLQKYVIDRVATSDAALPTILQRGSDRLTGESRADALRAVRQGDASVAASLREVRNASPDGWAQARADLANSYQQYADAAIHAENVSKGVAIVAFPGDALALNR